MKRSRLNRGGQIWVETVIYTLIGLAIIGLVLVVAKPKIEAKKDSIIIEQAIESLGNIDDKIYEVQKATGNRRSIDLKIGKGKVLINMDDNTISWIIDSSFEYSEKGISVPIGRINVTTKESVPWEVTLKLGYGVNLSHNGVENGIKTLDSAPIPYTLIIENKGMSGTGNLKIDLREA
ncbi:MAG: hypothetical protein NUV97_01875 [archaeon]|nr:hypothetical protein [archaeon]MCR4323702.1 hypothetical protein [Nanoarchaeota archaeon]